MLINNNEYDLKSRIKPFVLPLSIFVVVAILSATFGKYLVVNIFATRETIAQAKQENSNLLAKKNKLASLDKSLLVRQVKASVLAVPAESSGLTALASVRAQAFEKNVQITGIKVSETDAAKKLGKEVGLEFELSGSLPDIISLVNSLGKSAPIMRFTKIKMTGGETGHLSTDLDVKTFWVELPRTLPPASSVLAALTKKDEELLNEMENLRSAALTNIVPASASARENPFTP